jgi:signal transduction histidine kinase
MRLPEFIETHLEAIMSDWEAFARSIWPGGPVSRLVLRNHAIEMLLAISRDIRSSQTDIQQADKSKGLGEGGPTQRGENSDRINTASHMHALSRVSSGFELSGLVAEYRALRASVTKLWIQSEPHPDPHHLQDIIRFNEGIDQLLAESVTSYGNSVESSRQCFLGILGHDLRNPLASASMVAQLLGNTTRLDSRFTKLASTLSASLTAMGKLINDLLDFSGTRLGAKMTMIPELMDLRALCQEVIDEMQAAHPAHEFRLVPEIEGEMTGEWDGARLRQMISNLLGNAVQHGFASTPVTLRMISDGPSVRLAFHNQGPAIPEEALGVIFDPMKRNQPTEASTPPGSFGLGLFIAHEVASAHGGSVAVVSATDETVFTIQLPRSFAVCV